MQRFAPPTAFSFSERTLAKGDDGLGLDVVPGEDGIVVVDVVPGGAAAKAGGWRADDIIVLVNGQRVVGRTDTEMLGLLRDAAGQVSLGVLSRAFTEDGELRGGAGATATTEYVFHEVTLRRAAPEAGLGLDVVADADGVVVTGVVPGSPAAAVQGALRVGDIIVTVNGQRAHDKTQDEVVALLRESGETVVFGVLAKNLLHPRHRNDAQAIQAAYQAAAAAAAAAAATVAAPSASPPTGDAPAVPADVADATRAVAALAVAAAEAPSSAAEATAEATATAAADAMAPSAAANADATAAATAAADAPAAAAPAAAAEASDSSCRLM